MTAINIILLFLISFYVLWKTPKNRLEYLFLASYPFLCKVSGQLTLYFCLILILKKIFCILFHKYIKTKKEYLFLPIFVVYIILTIPVQGIDANYYIGLRNFVFFALSGYIVMSGIHEKKIIGNIVTFQAICSLFLSLYEICIVYNFTFNQSWRSYGFFSNPNYYAFYLVLLMELAIQFLDGRKCKIVLCILSVTIFLTLSEICFIIVAYMLYYHFLKGNLDGIIFIFLVSVCLILFVFLYIDPDKVYMTINSQTDRLQIWSVYAGIFFSMNPIIGIGFNRELGLYEKELPFMKVYDETGKILQAIGATPTHNEIYKILVGTGVVGAIIFFTGYYIYTKKMAKDNNIPNTGIMLLLMMCTHNVFFTIPFWLLLFLKSSIPTQSQNVVKNN